MTTSAARKTTAAARKTGAADRKSPARRAARKAAPKAAPAAAAVPAKQRPAATDKAKTAQADKPEKLKLVRDSFTIPKFEYGVLQVLKTRASHLGRPTKKSEIVRAGVKALEALTDADFLACLSSLPATKPARDAKT